MLFKPSVATVENASEVEGKATQLQGDARSDGPVPQVRKYGTQPSVNHGFDTSQEQKVTEHDAVHSLPPRDDKPNPEKSSNSPGNISIPKIFKLPEPRTIPKPDFDPFERLLKPMREDDTARCNAWKDEIQNILIFAGLFSAVVTAFIVESYQRLQPDPTNALVGLLAHIAEKLDNPSINGTASIASIVSDTNFSPSRSDIKINVYWFISLILSLTVALIGIITLQWLREHQRYDNTLKPQEKMAILNARLDSLQEWYVPKIFAGLPLLLQGALVLFFVGMIEFLFSLRLEVAIPVTLSICVPLIFLIATTLLPVLQIYILQDSFRLSTNNDIPSPCPYKSPQSFIFHRIGVHSKIVFAVLASIVAGAYVCVIHISRFLRKLVKYLPPIIRFRHWQPHIMRLALNQYPAIILNFLYARGAGWTSIDISWLSVRTYYAVKNNNDFMIYTEVLDCTRCFYGILDRGWFSVDHYALYYCVEALSSQAMAKFKKHHHWPYPAESSIADFCSALGELLCNVYAPRYSQPDPLITAAFIKDAILHKSPDGSEITVETLCAAFMHASWTTEFRASVEPLIQTIADDGASLLIVNRLAINPERLFTMSSGDAWLPQTLQYSPYLKENSSLTATITHLLHTFFDRCSTMQPNSQPVTRSAQAYEANEAVEAYMDVIVSYQPIDSLDDALTHIIQLCNANATSDLIREKPFLMIAACFYVKAVVNNVSLPFRLPHSDNAPNVLAKCQPLLNIIVKACGISRREDEITFGWSHINQAIIAIYNYHSTSNQPLHDSSSFTVPLSPNSHDNNVSQYSLLH